MGSSHFVPALKTKAGRMGGVRVRDDQPFPPGNRHRVSSCGVQPIDTAPLMVEMSITDRSSGVTSTCEAATDGTRIPFRGWVGLESRGKIRPKAWACPCDIGSGAVRTNHVAFSMQVLRDPVEV